MAHFLYKSVRGDVMDKIAVIGLGYVGLTTALVFANTGIEVIGIDKNENRVKLLKNKKMPFFEKECDKLLEKNFSKLCFTSNYNMISDVKVFFVCVGTPLNSKNYLDISEITNVVQTIKEYVKHNKSITICIRSTILPGTCNLISEISNFSIVHNPEFLSQGTAIDDFVNAKRIVIGSDDKKALKKIQDLYNKFIKRYNVDTPIVTMGVKDAEMVKFVANSYLAMRISFINEMSNLCKKIGVNISNVIDGVKYDERIGEKYFKNGIGYGGSCLPKDTNAILRFSKSKKSTLKLVKSTIEINNLQLKKCFKVIKHDFPRLKNIKVAILGVTFKANTDDIRNSCSLYLTNKLLRHNAKINVYDPKGLNSYRKIYGNKVTYYDEIDKCISECDIIIIATEWDTIKKYNFNNIKVSQKTFIYDFKSCIDEKNKFNSNIKYWSLGGNINGK